MPTCPRRHDLSLPAWGPYSRHYAALVHIPELDSGRTFELCVAVGTYRGQITVPSQRFDSAWYPAGAAPGLGHWSHRLEVTPEVDAEVRCDRVAGEDLRLVSVDLCNRGAQAVSLALHLLTACRYPKSPTSGSVAEVPLAVARVEMPDDGAWVDGRDYRERVPAQPGPRDGLAYDGWGRGEVRADHLVDGGGLAVAAGDQVTWDMPPGRRWLRWLGPGPLVIEVDGASHELPAAAQGDWCDLGPASGPVVLRVHSGAGAIIDGLACAGSQPTVVAWQPTPQPARTAARPDQVVLTYPDLPGAYGLGWNRPAAKLREIRSERLDEVLRTTAQNHVADVLSGDGRGHWTDILIQPIVVAAGGRETLRCLIVHGGDATDAGARLDAACSDLSAFAAHADAQAASTAGDGPWDSAPNPSGDAHRAAQRQMAATVLQNVAYPVYTRRRFIRHHTPGKTWDSLYTWDSGFISLALCDIAPQRAADSVAAYLTGPGDRDCAFIHHGTPLPVQVHAAQVLFNRTQDRDLIRDLWPGLLAMHRFLVGRDPDSLTARLGSGLLQTWAYFYNSGGWDDYPPQWHLYRNGGHASVAPAVTSAHVARSALILAQFAWLLGDDAAESELRADHVRLVAALDTHAWNEADGIYSYVEHDANGQPSGPIRHTSGVDFNWGLDGVSPLVARAGDPRRRQRLIERIFDPQRLWTDHGITTVDRTAPYYNPGGYWNGTVWMPHQWFLWRALLDLGRGDLAWRIASTALALWTREVGASHRCYEHFPVVGGRGAGWHHFGGLSSPVLSWYAAYHLPGRISTGADALVLSQQWETQVGVNARIRLAGEAGGVATIIVCCTPSIRRSVRFADAEPVWRERLPGTIEIDLPALADGLLRVTGWSAPAQSAGLVTPARHPGASRLAAARRSAACPHAPAHRPRAAAPRRLWWDACRQAGRRCPSHHRQAGSRRSGQAADPGGAPRRRRSGRAPRRSALRARPAWHGRRRDRQAARRAG